MAPARAHVQINDEQSVPALPLELEAHTVNNKQLTQVVPAERRRGDCLRQTAMHSDAISTPTHRGHPDITSQTRAQDAPTGLMTGAWEVPLPKPIPRQPSNCYTLPRWAVRVHRMSPSMDGSAASSLCFASPVLYLDVYVHAGANAGVQVCRQAQAGTMVW